MWCLLNIYHFSSTMCFDTMITRSQQDSEGKRVTAKSRLLMNLIVRTASHVSSLTSVSPLKRFDGSPDPWSSIAKMTNRHDLIKTQIFLKIYLNFPIIIIMRNSWKLLPWTIHRKLFFSKLFKIGWRSCLVFWVENWDHEIRQIETNW